MSSSNYGIRNRWSTPSLPNAGVHRLFMQSDQHYYMHKCNKCNHYNNMSYKDYNPDNLAESGNVLCVNPNGVDKLAKTVADGSFQYVCQKCGMPLDRWYSGTWVPKYANRTKDGDGVRGYFISQLNAVWVSLDDIKTKELQSKSKQSFYNYVLG